MTSSLMLLSGFIASMVGALSAARIGSFAAQDELCRSAGRVADIRLPLSR